MKIGYFWLIFINYQEINVYKYFDEKKFIHFIPY